MTNYIKLLELLNSYKLEDLKKELENNIREDAAKKAGNKSKLTIIKKLQKDAEKLPKNCQGVQPCKINDVDYNAFINSYMILADKTTDYGYTKSENGFNCSKMFSEKPEINYTLDIDDIKGFIALDKASRKAENRKTPKPYIIDLEDGRKAGFNPEYMLECLSFCDSNKIKLFSKQQANKDTTGYINPIHVESENFERLAVVLPVNL